MKTISKNRWLLPASCGLFLPIALVGGCGGGGGGISTPRATATPRATGTPTGTAIPTSQTTQAVGTYTGTYSLPSIGSEGPFILRVQTDGTATGVINEGVVDSRGDDQSILTSGTVNLSTGQVTLSGTFDLTDQIISSDPLPTTVTISGVANITSASGQVVLTNSEERIDGTFTTAKVSASPTAVPTSAPLAERKGTSLREFLSTRRRAAK